MGHGPCQTFIESCPRGVLQTERVVIQPESSGCLTTCYASRHNAGRVISAEGIEDCFHRAAHLFEVYFSINW